MDYNNKLLDSSNYGEIVDVYYIGYRIKSLYYKKTMAVGIFQYLTGTSMAAPFISGILSLQNAKEPFSLNKLKLYKETITVKPARIAYTAK